MSGVDPNPLARLDDSVLVVVDVQEKFLEKLEPSTSEALIETIAWITRLARHLDVPMVVTAEDVTRLGSIAPRLKAALPGGTAVHDKHVFGLAADPVILAHVESFGRGTCVLVGLETDVCIAQSAIGLMGRGYRVIVLADATGSPEHDAGLRRAEGAGALVMPVRTLLYEWLRTVVAAVAFQRDFLAVDPPPAGITL